MADVEEYAIEWTSPEDIAGSLTIIGTGLASWERAELLLDLNAGLPGDHRGKVVSRTITWSEWREETERVRSTARLPRVTGFREVDPG